MKTTGLTGSLTSQVSTTTSTSVGSSSRLSMVNMTVSSKTVAPGKAVLTPGVTNSAMIFTLVAGHGTLEVSGDSKLTCREKKN